MTTVQTIYDDAKKRRVVILQRDDGSFGFSEERFADEPHEQAWIPVGRYSVSHCDTAERALVEARGRVAWLSECDHEDVA
jgi:hypothetical protein